MDEEYVMRAERVLGDDHSFVRLVDTLPTPLFCDWHPGDEDEDRWDEIMDEANGLPEGVFCKRPIAFQLKGHEWFCHEHGIEAVNGDQDRLTPITTSGDQRIVNAARVSIAGQDVRPSSDDTKLIRYLVRNKHTTPLEQVRFTFHVRLPIFVARQWIRHRTGSFNEESARYGKLAADFYIPTMDRLSKGGQAKKNKQGSGEALSEDKAGAAFLAIENASEEAYRRYERLLESGLARELARMVLPVNIYTQWFWTTDLHNLMHFLRLRLHSHAQWEVRQYAEAMLPMIELVAPAATAAFKETL